MEGFGYFICSELLSAPPLKSYYVLLQELENHRRSASASVHNSGHNSWDIIVSFLLHNNINNYSNNNWN